MLWTLHVGWRQEKDEHSYCLRKTWKIREGYLWSWKKTTEFCNFIKNHVKLRQSRKKSNVSTLYPSLCNWVIFLTKLTGRVTYAVTSIILSCHIFLPDRLQQKYDNKRQNFHQSKIHSISCTVTQYTMGNKKIICLTSLTLAKCGIPSTLCWKIPNISGSIELFAL